MWCITFFLYEVALHVATGNHYETLFAWNFCFKGQLGMSEVATKEAGIRKGEMVHMSPTL